MASARIDLPCFRLAHAPNLDLPVVCRGDNEGKSGVERRPVNTPIVTLEDILDSGEVVEGVECAGRSVWGILAKSGDVPHAYSLVLGSRHDEILFGVELRRHHIVRVTGEYSDTVP